MVWLRQRAVEPELGSLVQDAQQMHDHEVTECICTDLLSFRCAWHFSFFFFVCVCVCEMLAAHFSDSLLSFLYASWNLNNEINRKDKTEAI